MRETRYTRFRVNVHESRITFHESRFTIHVSRVTFQVTMRRKLLIGAISLLSLILILLIAVFIYVRSGQLDVFLQRQVIAALADVGINARIGSAHLDIRGSTVTLKNVELYAGDGQKPFGAIEKLTAQFSVLSYLHQRIQITQVKIEHPHAWIEFDEQGRSNLASLHSPPSKKEVKEEQVTFLTSNFEVSGAEIAFVDRQRNITGQITDMSAHLVPLENAAIYDKLNHRLEFGFTGATASIEGREIHNITANILAHVTEENAEIMVDPDGVPQFKFSSDLGELKLKGKVESFEPLKYNFSDVSASAALEQVSRVFIPDTKMTGQVGFIGKVNGTGADYHAEGALESSAVTAEGF